MLFGAFQTIAAVPAAENDMKSSVVQKYCYAAKMALLFQLKGGETMVSTESLDLGPAGNHSGETNSLAAANVGHAYRKRT